MQKTAPFILFVLFLVWPALSHSQGSGVFQAPLEIEDADFGEWTGAELVSGDIIPTDSDGFCILYEYRGFFRRQLSQLDYTMIFTGPSAGGDFVLSNGVNDLPVTFQLSPASGSIISISGTPEAKVLPSFPYAVEFPVSPVDDFDFIVNLPNYLAPNGCADAKFDFLISINSQDIVALAEPTGDFRGDFQIDVNSPVLGLFLPGSDVIRFSVEISVTSSVYIDQLPSSIDLAATTRQNFCLWSFDGVNVDVTISANNPAYNGYNFSLQLSNDNDVVVDSIGYALSLRDIAERRRFGNLSNGQVIAGRTTASAAANDTNCSTGGLNYRLIFDLEDYSSKEAGFYSDTITIVITPN